MISPFSPSLGDTRPLSKDPNLQREISTLFSQNTTYTCISNQQCKPGDIYRFNKPSSGQFLKQITFRQCAHYFVLGTGLGMVQWTIFRPVPKINYIQPVPTRLCFGNWPGGGSVKHFKPVPKTNFIQPVRTLLCFGNWPGDGSVKHFRPVPKTNYIQPVRTLHCFGNWPGGGSVNHLQAIS